MKNILNLTLFFFFFFFFFLLAMSPGQDSLEHLPASEQILQSLSELARSFQEMADRCLLVLHLEVRVHCFHYLIPLAKQGNYAIVANVESMDYDPLVVRLNKDISAIEEAMSASLQQHKFQYIFEGQALPRPSSIKGFSILILKLCRIHFR
uniref:Exocyst complex component Sec8 n=1 Tax=Zosterops lateralis melanops TaxID=1220523 RepID=A0A8D2PQX4_ZOSLA